MLHGAKRVTYDMLASPDRQLLLSDFHAAIAEGE